MKVSVMLSTPWEKHYRKLPLETGDRRGEGVAYGNLGNAYKSLGDSLGDHRKAT